MYDAFRERLMFPIIELRGNVIAFGGRRLGQQGPKYLNSADSPVFKKSRNLFALNIARKSPSKRIILAEGYMDVISLHQAGFTTAVATLGTAIGQEQAKLLSDYGQELVICYDGDEAGQKATARAIAILENTPLKVRVLSLQNAAKQGQEKAKDPDDYIRMYGPQSFERILDASGNTIEYALDKAKKQFDLSAADGTAAYIRAALNILAQEALPAEQDIYAGRIAQDTGVAKTAILSQLEGLLHQRRRQFAKDRDKRMKQEGIAASVSLPYSAGANHALATVFAEQQLVAAVLKNPEDFLPMLEKSLSPKEMISPEMGKAFELILEKQAQGAYISLASLSGELPEKTIAILGKVLALNHNTGFLKQDVEMFLKRILSTKTQSANVALMADEDLLKHMQELRGQKIDQE